MQAEKTSMDQNDTNFNYYHQYCRLYLANVVLMSQIRQLASERNQLTGRFVKLQRKGQDILDGQRAQDDKKKRFRRTANEIQRHYRCPVDTCQRSYGSQGSLNQHIKIKHYQIYKQLNLNQLSDESKENQSLISRKYYH